MNSTILIVDDSLTVRADLAEAFAEVGLPTIACASAAEARATLATQAVGLIILDVLLPDADGVDLLKEIRATPAGADTPVLMLSTEAEVRDRIRGLVTGSNDYVGKPYDREYVITRARELLDGAYDESDRPQPKTVVLVIDDSATFRERFSEILRAQGFDVLNAATGEEGLRSAALNRPAVVVVDGVLPGIDGPTVVRKLRLDAALRHTPCILLTGSVDQSAELHALDSGADAFVRKEEELDMILARVTAVLRSAGSTGSENETASLLSSKKILAVDDSETYLQELGETLSGEGYDVILARSGEEALDMVAVQSVDCILLDRLMPGMGGTEACRRIKASPATRDIPLIMLTAMEDRDAMIEGLSTGADDYVLKSNELDVLKARVRAQLRRKQFEDESRRIRTELMNKELDAAEARAARELAESRAGLLAILEQKNRDLEAANAQLLEGQREIAIKNQQVEEASRLKSEFLSNMSHELRTPLNAIIGFSEVLKDGLFGDLTQRQNNYVTQVFHSGQHLLALINDILDLSKIEAGKMTLTLEEITPNELLQACFGIVLEKAVKRGIALRFDACADNERIVADARKLRQIVYNLLSNAVKFTADGGEVRLSGRRVKRSALKLARQDHMATRLLPLPPSEFEDFLEIRVSDSGIGISRQDLPQLFQSFVQLDSSMARHHEGTGLGLALVSRMAELHGGTVGVASAPGHGTLFTVWLPWRVATAGDGPLAGLSNRTQAPLALNNLRQVLLVEDDQHTAALLRRYLESVGFQVHCAPDIVSALGMAQRQPPDLIMLDLLSPGASGWEAHDQIKASPALDGIPIVMVSMLADDVKGFALGAVRTLLKPITCEMLLDAIAAMGPGVRAIHRSTLLVVDGDSRAVDPATVPLEEHYCKVLRAHDDHTAIEIARQTPPDLMIIDLMWPGINGFALVDALKREPETAAIPILLVIAKAVSGQERERLNGLIGNVMEKGGFNRQRFLQEVGRALGKK